MPGASQIAGYHETGFLVVPSLLSCRSLPPSLCRDRRRSDRSCR